MNWQDIQLGEAIHVKHGFAFKGEFFASSEDYMVLTPGNFFEKGGFRVREGKERFYTSDIPEAYILSPEDLIIAMTEQGDGLLGSAARISSDGKFLHNQRLGLIDECDPKLINKRFLYWLFNSPSVRAQIRSTATGAKVKHIASERIYKVKVSVPPVPEQAAIAFVLDAYDDLIAANQRRIQLLEESARLLYREWFVKLRFPEHETVPVVDGVPEGWDSSRLIEIADVNSSSISVKDQLESIRYVDISSVETGEIGDIEEITFDEAPGRARRKVKHGDVIWSCVRHNRRSYTLIWEPENNIIVSTGFAVLSAGSVPFSYLYFVTTTDDFVNHLTNQATGAPYPAVTAKDFEKATILRPDAETLASFDKLVLPILEQINTIKNHNKQLKQARDLLLPRLMSGALDVSRIAVPREVEV